MMIIIIIITVAIQAYESGYFTPSNSAQSGYRMESNEGDGEGARHESFNLRNSCLVQCDAVYLSRKIPKFRTNLLPAHTTGSNFRRHHHEPSSLKCLDCYHCWV